ncbi:hypothetical protein A0H81_12123 [Grifola frondosa]|uniref:Uncharacterized protein n=1 Tax=Grifola frondosa TaxID=5627 RepID=A0A1C7LTV6_GRIFR|nr:hypothetical protein A0H81_12123 [Grifola frondosa]
MSGRVPRRSSVASPIQKYAVTWKLLKSCCRFVPPRLPQSQSINSLLDLQISDDSKQPDGIKSAAARSDVLPPRYAYSHERWAYAYGLDEDFVINFTKTHCPEDRLRGQTIISLLVLGKRAIELAAGCELEVEFTYDPHEDPEGREDEGLLSLGTSWTLEFERPTQEKRRMRRQSCLGETYTVVGLPKSHFWRPATWKALINA